MDLETAKANLTTGSDAALIARCMDTLLKEHCNDPAFIEPVAPFLGPSLIERRVIDYSIEAGVDITDSYFVLWEPFIRAKAALLIGTIVESAESVPQMTEIVNQLVENFLKETSEEIESAFSFYAITRIGLVQPESVMPHFAKLVKKATAMVGLAAAPPKAFDLFHSIPFRTQTFEDYLNFVQIAGIFEVADNVQRLAASGFHTALLQIALSAQLFIEKHPELQWTLITVFARFITEYPNGYQLIDLDKLPRQHFNDCCTVIRQAVIHHDQAGAFRNAIDAVPKEGRTQAAFVNLGNIFTK